MSRSRAKVGDVIQITAEPTSAQIGSRDYQFVVGVHDGVFHAREVSVAGFDPSLDEADDWPPPSRVDDSISGAPQIYERGVIRPATSEECAGLEPAAVWELQHLIERLIRS